MKLLFCRSLVGDNISHLTRGSTFLWLMNLQRKPVFQTDCPGSHPFPAGKGMLTQEDKQAQRRSPNAHIGAHERVHGFA
jgi:hypothetical protein